MLIYLKLLINVSIFLALSGSLAWAEPTVADRLQQLYGRLAASPLLVSDPQYPQALSAAKSGDFAKIAELATDADGFYNVTLRHFASPMSNRAHAVMLPLNEFTMTIIGVARDNQDARSLLTGDFVYHLSGRGGSPILEPKEETHLNLRKLLVKSDQPKVFENQETAGLLTTYQWAREHYRDGTNRRAVYFSFSEFLCTSLTEIRDTTVPDQWVRRDVPRAPGGNPETYQKDCRGCHGGMDALAGAFAYLDFQDDQFISETSKVAGKFNRNAHIFPLAPNHVTDSSWTNLWNQGKGASLGWRSKSLRGTGVKAFGKMLAQSEAFSRCFAKRAFLEVCQSEGSEKVIHELAKRFETDDYNLRKLFQHVALEKECLAQ